MKILITFSLMILTCYVVANPVVYRELVKHGAKITYISTGNYEATENSFLVEVSTTPGLTEGLCTNAGQHIRFAKGEQDPNGHNYPRAYALAMAAYMHGLNVNIYSHNESWGAPEICHYADMIFVY